MPISPELKSSLFNIGNSIAGIAADKFSYDLQKDKIAAKRREYLNELETKRETVWGEGVGGGDVGGVDEYDWSSKAIPLIGDISELYYKGLASLAEKGINKIKPKKAEEVQTPDDSNKEAANQGTVNTDPVEAQGFSPKLISPIGGSILTPPQAVTSQAFGLKDLLSGQYSLGQVQAALGKLGMKIKFKYYPQFEDVTILKSGSKLISRQK